MIAPITTKLQFTYNGRFDRKYESWADDTLRLGRASGEIIMKYLPAFFAATFVFASPVSGHHSDVALDLNSVVTFEGTVTEFSLRNPHTYFTVATTNESGAQVEWTVQMASAITVSRRCSKHKRDSNNRRMAQFYSPGGFPGRISNNISPLTLKRVLAVPQ